MSEKYYVCSESDLVMLRDYCEDTRHAYYKVIVARAEAACRARPVPEWATHFACEIPPKLHYLGVHLKRIER
jgi:hypothetical protein